MPFLTVDIVNKCKDQGMNCTEVAKLLSVNVSTVYSFCKRNGIELKKPPRGGHNVKDITDAEFGSLIVKGRSGSKGALATWECECACGNKVVYTGADLRQGKATTCGCKINVVSRRNWQGFGDIPKTYWSSMFHNAHRRNIDFSLTMEEAHVLWKKSNGRCALSGLEISFQNRTASLDRIDNNKGYTVNNTEWLHKDVNKLKSTFTRSRLIELCRSITVHQQGVIDVAEITDQRRTDSLPFSVQEGQCEKQQIRDLQISQI